MLKEKTQKTFQDFTNLYEVSKTLRFELRPVGNTQKMLEDNEVFEKDKTRQEKYEKAKPYFDRMHREFVVESLKKAELKNLNDYFDIFKKWQKDKKDKKILKELEKQEKELREQIVGLFNKKAKEYSTQYDFLKKKDYNLFFEKEVFQLLKEKYGKEEEAFVFDEASKQNVSIFNEWKNFTGYFKKFHETRKNFYKADGKSTAVATRAIDQNLKRFCDNWLEYKKIKDKINFSEVEKKFNVKISEELNPLSYSKFLLQTGINKYNDILGGKTLDSGKKIKGINELINEYRQNNKGEKPKFLKKLDKQILGEKEKMIFENEINKENILEELEIFKNEALKRIDILKELLAKFKNDNVFELDKIYISKEAFNTIAHKWTQVVFDFECAMASELKIKEKDGKFSFPDFIDLESIKKALEEKFKNEVIWKNRYYKDESKNQEDKGFLEVSSDVWDQFLQIMKFEFKNNFDLFEKNKRKLNEYLKNNNFQNKKEDKEIIREFADAVLRIYSMGKYFALEKKRNWKGDEYNLCSVFYEDPNFGYYSNFYENAYEEIVKKYNNFRNFLTKKPWEDVQKWKLNFENATLATGWDKNKEKDNSAVIFKKDEKYYLGLMSKGNNQIFTDKNKEKFDIGTEKGKYEKMVYKYNKDVVTGIPKSSTQMKEVIEHFKNSDEDYILEKGSSVGTFLQPLKISKEIFDLNNKIFLKSDLSKSIYRWDLKDKNKESDYIKSFQKDFIKLGGSKEIYKNSVKKWINFCLYFLKSYPSSAFFDYSKLKPVDDYKAVDECYKDMNEVGYKISWQDISEEYIKGKNQNGELYLFEIYNRDFAKKAKGKKKLHTMYFETLFSKENEENNFLFKLNGEAELFFRPKTIEEKRVKRNFKREIIEKKRYTKDKIFFHFPITLNRSKGNIFQFNKKINEVLANNSDINIIGIDRGEKHLAYYSVIKQNGDIVEMRSLNTINGVNYSEKLEEKAKQREQARKDWDNVEAIKDLKKGYISQVVRKLADLAIEHNAIIVFEDLNMRFKQVRGGIEKSIYQQLEKALIEKLNFLVEKGEKDSQKAGHLLRAYQLTAPFDTFKDMGKQTGIIFYTQAGYTSVTDPITGFKKNIYIKNSAPIKKIKEELNKFKEIAWDDKGQSYFFRYDINDFNKSLSKKEWKVYAKTPCLRREKKDGYWECEEFKANEKLKELFKVWDFDNLEGDILDQIQAKDANGDFENKTKDFDGKKRNFYQALIYIFNLIIDIRNSASKNYKKDKEGNLKETGEDVDFIASPVEPFFTTQSKYSKANFGKLSDKYIGKDKNKFLAEYNGDANGAYNIARKGIMILEKISEWKKENEELKKIDKKEKNCPDLFISNIDWDKRNWKWAKDWYDIK